MLLIHPPLTKSCEAPAALGYLSSALINHGLACTTCDMSIEGFHYLLQTTTPATDTWSKRAFKNCDSNIIALQHPETYRNLDKYTRAVSDLNRILEIAGKIFDLQLSLSNYQDNNLSPLKSSDLRLAARNYKENIYYDYFNERFQQLFSEKRYKYIGFSINYLSQALCTFAMIGFIRDHYPHCEIIVGGGLVTTWLSHPDWHNSFNYLIDHFIGGPGDAGLIKLHGVKHLTPHTRPDYKDLALNNYLSPGFVLPYTTSSGCFWKKCNFCPETSENNPYIHVPPQTTCQDVNQLSNKLSPSLLHFLDNAISPSTLKAIATSPPLPPWYGFVRFDSLLCNREFCMKLKQSGCVMLKLGLESGSQKVLDKMNKGINLETASKILTNLADVGIKTYIYLLFGTPEETIKEAELTLEFVEKHHQMISFLNLAIFNLPICSDAAHQLEVAEFYNGDLSIYSDFKHPHGWNRRAIRRFLQNDFKASDSISKILKRDPPFFTSNHAPFFSVL